VTEQSELKKRRERSPSYPAIPLAAAVERARVLYRQEKSYPTPINTILEHWNYRHRSGSGLVTVAALLKFGLLEDEGSGPTRRARITELAQRIIRDNREDSPEREKLLKESALLPQIHRELWEKYHGSLPSDSNLAYTLKIEYGFTDLGATEFIKEFRATVSFARLGESDEDWPVDPADLPHQVDHAEPTAAAPDRPSARVYGGGPAVYGSGAVYGAAPPAMVFPLPRGEARPDLWPSLHVPEKLSEADWKLMLDVLNSIKAAIIAAPETKAPAGLASGTGTAFDAAVETTSGPSGEPSGEGGDA
jgi:hypothetical protein